MSNSTKKNTIFVYLENCINGVQYFMDTFGYSIITYSAARFLRSRPEIVALGLDLSEAPSLPSGGIKQQIIREIISSKQIEGIYLTNKLQGVFCGEETLQMMAVYGMQNLESTYLSLEMSTSQVTRVLSILNTIDSLKSEYTLEAVPMEWPIH